MICVYRDIRNQYKFDVINCLTGPMQLWSEISLEVICENVKFPIFHFGYIVFTLNRHTYSPFALGFNIIN